MASIAQMSIRSTDQPTGVLTPSQLLASMPRLGLHLPCCETTQGGAVCSCPRYNPALVEAYARAAAYPPVGYSPSAYPMTPAVGFYPPAADANMLYSTLGPAYQRKEPCTTDAMRLAVPSAYSTAYDSSLTGYPYTTSYGGIDARRKNATRESTSTLKAWLYEHRKNPYPTKGEKIMLAIITKMTLTQVSTWFANARRRLKKDSRPGWDGTSKEGDDDDEGEIGADEIDDIDEMDIAVDEVGGDDRRALSTSPVSHVSSTSPASHGISSHSEESPRKEETASSIESPKKVLHRTTSAGLTLHHHPTEATAHARDCASPETSGSSTRLAPAPATIVVSSLSARPSGDDNNKDKRKPKIWSIDDFVTPSKSDGTGSERTSSPNAVAIVSSRSTRSPALTSPSSSPLTSPSPPSMTSLSAAHLSAYHSAALAMKLQPWTHTPLTYLPRTHPLTASRAMTSSGVPPPVPYMASAPQQFWSEIDRNTNSHLLSRDYTNLVLASDKNTAAGSFDSVRRTVSDGSSTAFTQFYQRCSSSSGVVEMS